MEQIILSINWNVVTFAGAVLLLLCVVIYGLWYYHKVDTKEPEQPNGTVSKDIEEGRKRHEARLQDNTNKGVSTGIKSDYVSSPTTNETQTTDSSTLALLLKQGKSQTIDDLVSNRGMSKLDATEKVMKTIDDNNLKWDFQKRCYVYK